LEPDGFGECDGVPEGAGDVFCVKIGVEVPSDEME
jgi:hypothetical protein